LLENGDIHCIFDKSYLGEGVCLWNKTEGSFYVHNGYFSADDTFGYVCEDGIKRKRPYICPKGYFGEEMLGRVTSSSALINMVPCQDNVSVYIDYGTSSGIYDRQTEILIGFIREALEITLSELLPDTKYYYRVMEKSSDENYFSPRKEGSFFTKKSPGSSFKFVVTADSHYHQVNGVYAELDPDILRLFEQTFQNILVDCADFLIDLGDSFFTDYGITLDAFQDIKSQLEGYERYEDLRKQLDKIHHALPYYFVLGNHEGELGFYFFDLAQWSENARKLYVPNPDETTYPEGGSKDENYYAFTWGDALFIILDPFRYTLNFPKTYGLDAWTLGTEQLFWLESTLENSDAQYKFIFIHHLVGGCGTYGRGGVKCANNGEWGRLIHPMLVQNNVSIVFHGHDHAFVDEVLDGIRYTEVPNPYPEEPWAENPMLYNVSDVLHSPGHLLINVTPISVTVEYIGSSLNTDNGEVKYRYEINN
jgi:predicted MPP superfamily phosphohydrolase